jgi:hypothetical protein
MKWFDQWFVRKCKWAWENRDIADVAESLNAIRSSSTKHLVLQEEDSSPWNDGLRINVKKMIGGYVVSFRYYDRVKDRSDDRNYIITDEQDFNAELGKMITMESMRQTQ